MTNESTDNKNSLNILKMLCKKEISKDEILQNLNIKSSTFHKHLNLIKQCGFRVKKNKDKYRITKHKNLCKLAQYEQSIMSYLFLIVYIMLPKNKLFLFDKAAEKILSIIDKDIVIDIEKKYEKYKLNALSEHYNKKILILKKFIDINKQIQIILKNSQELNIVPLKLTWEKNKIYLEYNSETDEIKNILLDNIVKINEIKKEIKLTDSHETIFELYGKLSKSYLLKENERVVDFTKDKIIIANSSKDKNKLFKRLLRYDTFCKVTFPKTDYIKFKTIIEKSLANIEEFKDNI